MISLPGEFVIYSYSMSRDRIWFGNGHQERVSHNGGPPDLGAAAIRLLAKSESLVQDFGRGPLVAARVRTLLRSWRASRVVMVSRLAGVVTTTPLEVVGRDSFAERSDRTEAFEEPTTEEMSRKIRAAFERSG